ncbi:hypothetical protein [Paenibacillus harenae]|uniref:hypothetical protein n=1 Tax=Paenibacillus harenae TaxID=306543 RepID=UPI00042930C2|nr:hypothetical protein [Paenibacillus harenae]
MKIEIGESLIYSWLRHSKGCQLVQMNWKISASTWEMKNEEALRKLMVDSIELFRSKYGMELYKGTASLSQLLQQAEIDVLGICIEESDQYLYAVDVAFHEGGLNYGSKDETIMRVAKKILRTAMCLYGYFNLKKGEIIFASPKINLPIVNGIMESVPLINELLHSAGLHYDVRIICNEGFDEKIMQPVLGATSSVADTSELFMRSMQMYNMFTKPKRKASELSQVSRLSNDIKDKPKSVEGKAEMKIGEFVRSVLTKMLQNHEITEDEIELMQTSHYSKETFDIQYPLLRKASLSNGEKVLRYWARAVEAYGEQYFICSEWYEVPQNNDRPFFMKWLGVR